VDQDLEIARPAAAMGVAALEELQFRRKGLVVSLFSILLVVLDLHLEIRHIEKPESESREEK
jgi:hypothetical protein